MDTKQNCILSLARALGRAGQWRFDLQSKFPNDSRNGEAAERLSQLAEEVVSLTDEQWSQLEPFYHWASEAWTDALSQATRHVVFHRHVRTLQGFVNDLASILTEQRAAA